MIVKYIIEIYDPAHKRYHPTWIGHDYAWAEKMLNKPYNARHTRRLMKVTTELLCKAKGKIR